MRSQQGQEEKKRSQQKYKQRDEPKYASKIEKTDSALVVFFLLPSFSPLFKCKEHTKIYVESKTLKGFLPRELGGGGEGRGGTERWDARRGD